MRAVLVVYYLLFVYFISIGHIIPSIFVLLCGALFVFFEGKLHINYLKENELEK